MSKVSKEQEQVMLQELYGLVARIDEICETLEYGDWTSYARIKEILAAAILGHTISDTYSGADAINEEGQKVEYKSTIAKRCKGLYTGISNQETWALMDKYLIEKKILPYDWHYYNRFEGASLVESWSLPAQIVYDLLRPKVKRSYETRHNRKDSRCSGNVTWTEINKYGEQVVKNGKRIK